MFLVVQKYLATLILVSVSTGAQAQQPNIIFFLVDDMGWQETSVPFHTETTPLNETYRTPHMKQLADEGLLFTSAYACAVCSPTRVSLMTGQNAARHKVTCWTLRKNRTPEPKHPRFAPAPWNLNGLQPVGADIAHSVEAVTLPQLLRDAGYRTIHVGKAHFGAKGTPGADPEQLGFDVNIAGHAAGGPGSYHGDRDFSADWRGGDRIWDVPGLKKYHGQSINLTEALTREAIEQVEQAVAENTPFYLYMSHYTVHSPLEPDRRFIKDYRQQDLPRRQAILASMLEGMDKSLGDLRATIEQLGVADKTLIVFMSDNGSPSQCPPNLPLRGHKNGPYEGGTRVPFIVSWPGVTQRGLRADTPVIVEDIFPTFIEVAGAEAPKNATVDGQSFVPILHDTQLDRSDRPLFWHYPNYYNQQAFSSVRLGDWKLVYWHDNPRLELYNIRHDLGEANNLVDQEPERADQLASKLANHLRETNAVMPVVQQTGLSAPLPDAF